MNSKDDNLISFFEKYITPNDCDILRGLQNSKKAAFLLEKSSLNQEQIAKSLSDISGIEYSENIDVADNPDKIISVNLILEYSCIPLKSKSESELCLATPWLPSADEVLWIKALTGKNAKWKIVPVQKLSEIIAQRFGVGANSFAQNEANDFSNINDSDIEEDENAAIIKFVNEIVTRALADRATDIHIEPQKESLNIRYRIDGNLIPVKLPENLLKFKDAIISRIKIMARLNISEKRRPQDGRINFVSKTGVDIDIRVSSLPTLYGESISLRLLTQKSQPVTIKDLGFMEDDMLKIEGPLSRPHGIILVTGPTGSGKSTTLTAFIRKLRNPQIRIITVEDPVEYEVENVNQTQIQSEIGLTFSAVLRSVLRQDPDIIMIGEIRDRETADIAIRASLTGHLVLSTLHTNDAAGALTRLIDMDIEPFLIASSIEMILAQRLVRKLCSCKQKANFDIKYLESCTKSLGISEKYLENCEGICKPVGCPKCRNIGYFGRVGIFEILVSNENMHNLIVGKRTAGEIRNFARSNGMRTLQECGFELLRRGQTGLEEIMAYANSDK